MAYNKKVRAKKGSTGFTFHTPLYDEDGNVLVLANIDFPHCTFTLTVADKTTGVVAFSGTMVQHTDQVTYPNHVAYVGTAGNMANPAATYNWEISFTDSTGKITKYPTDDGDTYGTFTMMPSLT